MKRAQDMTCGAIPMWETAWNPMSVENAMEHRTLEYMTRGCHTLLIMTDVFPAEAGCLVGGSL